MKKNSLVIAMFAASILGTTIAHADGSSSRNLDLSKETDSTAQEVAQKTENSSGWDWTKRALKRTDVGYEMMDYRKPTWLLETIQSVYQTPDSLSNTTLFQGRWAYHNYDSTFNLGLGYRHLLENQSWIFGVNGFFDATTKYDHRRLSAGAEAINNYVTLRANYYQAITSKKEVSYLENTSTSSSSSTITTTLYKTHNYEQALNGYDGELDLPVPFIPWIRVAANLFHFEHETSGKDNVHGNILIIRNNLTKYLSVELGRKHDNLLASQKYILVTLNLFGTLTNGVEGTMTDCIFNPKAFHSRDLAEHTLDKIPRRNDIVTEQTSHTDSSSINTNKGFSIKRIDVPYPEVEEG